jgi:hypothetical protein
MGSYVMVAVLCRSHAGDAPITAWKRKRLAQVNPAKRRRDGGKD